MRSRGNEYGSGCKRRSTKEGRKEGGRDDERRTTRGRANQPMKRRRVPQIRRNRTELLYSFFAVIFFFNYYHFKSKCFFKDDMQIIL